MLLFSQPPPTKRLDLRETIHGVTVADPYRWLEDLDSPETRAWVQAQSAYARRYLDAIPGRERFRRRLTDLYNFVRPGFYLSGDFVYAGIVKRGGRYFLLRQNGLENQPVLYVQEAGGKPRELINPNKLSLEGVTAVSAWAPSADGKWIAYGLAKAGSDWQQWRIRDVATGADLPDTLDWIKFATPVWAPDGSGIYYARYPEPETGALLTAQNQNNKLYFHRLRTQQQEDRLIYQRPDQPEWSFDPWLTSDGRYLLILVSQGTAVEKLVFYQDLGSSGPLTELVSRFEGAYAPLGNRGSVVYFLTTFQAPKGRIVSIDLSAPKPAAWKEVLPESQDNLEMAVLSGGRLICRYLADARDTIRIYSLDGKRERQVALPGLGAVSWALGEPEEPEQFYSFSSFQTPPSLYRYDLRSGRSRPYLTDRLPFDPMAFETRQVFYPSKDGTRIPMFLAHKKDLKLDGRTPTLLYGYGGFNIALRPQFSPLYLAWIEMGGLFAMANLRGGGEYGEQWHRAGMKHNKQNVFDDFIAAAEWLIANRYTSSGKLAIIGGSNGGLLVGACLNQRPDLFAAAIPMVGVMDMLRFHKFTIGRAWVSDYGSPDDPQDFQVLLRYSPLHNIRPGVSYPPVLIMTADHDDRVVPSHSFKYGAALQHAQAGKAPILLRIETSAGHGAGKPTAKLIEEQTDILAFLTQALGISGPR